MAGAVLWAFAVHSAEPLVYCVPPRVLYQPGGAADVLWDLPAATGAELEYARAGGPATLVPAGAPGTHFAVRLTGLARDTEYTARLRTRAADGDRLSAPFTFDTTFSYERPPVAAAGAANPDQARLAERLVPDPERARGICLVYGLSDGRLALEIARRSRYRVLGWDEVPERVESIRRYLLQAGVYGQQVTVTRTPSLAALPVAGGIVDLLVSEGCAEGRLPGRAAEVVRLLRPDGGRAELGPWSTGAAPRAAATVEAWLAASPVPPALLREGEQTWARIVRPPLPGAGAWTHQYGDAGNSANSWDALLGATGTTDLDTQWLGRPGADFGIDRNPRMPAPLVAAGRLFHQGLNRIAALNAYNGTILWTLEVPDLRRVNIPRDAGNWCADDTGLFAAVAGCCLQLEAATGQERQVFRLPEAAKASTHEWGWVARAGGLLLGSSSLKGAAYREFWGGEAWYDGRTGAGTEKVCSDAIFALEVAGDPLRARWVHGGQAIINSTLAVAAGAVLFVESRNPLLAKAPTGRGGEDLWQDLFLVSLDLETGTRRWETAIEGRPGSSVFFLAAVPEAIVLTASAQGEYRLTCVEPGSGAVRWSAAHPWPSDNHGGHMQHPVLSATTAFLEPHAYDLKTGTRQPGTIGRHEGCATYAGAQGALIYRGQARCVAMWDIASGQVTTWPNLRPSCWLNTVAGSGLVLIPEGGGGCSCGTWLETSIGFAPHRLQQGGTP